MRFPRPWPIRRGKARKLNARALAASKIGVGVMLSCNPATFARDAAILAAGGFALSRLAVFDQFKFSPHVEIAAVFMRASNKKGRLAPALKRFDPTKVFPLRPSLGAMSDAHIFFLPNYAGDSGCPGFGRRQPSITRRLDAGLALRNRNGTRLHRFRQAHASGRCEASHAQAMAEDTST